MRTAILVHVVPTFAPMLATSSTLPAPGDRWAYEVKWDGVRAIATVSGARTTIAGRHGRDATPAYPELGAPAGVEAHEVVVDGEIVAFDDEGRPSFERLQQRMHVRDRSAAARLAGTVPVVYCVFDLLWLDGEDLTALPYSERRRRLASLDCSGGCWMVPPASIGDPAPIRALVEARGFEGVMAKRVDSPYLAGRRSSTWIKAKAYRRQEFVVVGWSDGERSAMGLPGSLALGVHDRDGVLRYAGKVGTGFTHAELARLAALLAPLATDTCPVSGSPPPPSDVRFVRPEVVVEVRFGEWTSVGVIRHPSYLGQRTDIDPAAVVREP